MPLRQIQQRDGAAVRDHGDMIGIDRQGRPFPVVVLGQRELQATTAGRRVEDDGEIGPAQLQDHGFGGDEHVGIDGAGEGCKRPVDLAGLAVEPDQRRSPWRA